MKIVVGTIDKPVRCIVKRKVCHRRTARRNTAKVCHIGFPFIAYGSAPGIRDTVLIHIRLIGLQIIGIKRSWIQIQNCAHIAAIGRSKIQITQFPAADHGVGVKVFRRACSVVQNAL